MPTLFCAAPPALRIISYPVPSANAPGYSLTAPSALFMLVLGIPIASEAILEFLIHAATPQLRMVGAYTLIRRYFSAASTVMHV